MSVIRLVLNVVLTIACLAATRIFFNEASRSTADPGASLVCILGTLASIALGIAFAIGALSIVYNWLKRLHLVD